MTLGNMRERGVRSLNVSCWNCQHQAGLSADVRRSAELERTAAAGVADRDAMGKLSDDTIVYWWSRTRHDIPGPSAVFGDRRPHERDNESRPTPAR
jgi:hypothetical protein